MDFSPPSGQTAAQQAPSSGASGTLGSSSSWLIVSLLVVAGLFYAYSQSFTQLLHYWDRAEYGHGYIIPFVALLLAWHDLTEKRPQPSGSWLGAPLLLIGFLWLVIGQLSTFNAVAIYGLIVSLVGLSLCLMGPAATRVLRPAFIYLLFAVPLPDFIY